MIVLLAIGWLVAVVGLALACYLHLKLRRRMGLVAWANHELRRPVGAALLGVETILRLGHPRRGQIELLEFELQQARLALDDLTDVQAGRSPHYHWELIDLEMLLEDVVARAQISSGREIDMKNYPPAHDPMVYGDTRRLTQAISNLIDNALEHGTGLVSVRVLTGGNRVTAEVANEGGLLPHQTNGGVSKRSHWKNQRGHGLAITAAIAAFHGGSLNDVSVEHRTCIELRLPHATSNEVPSIRRSRDWGERKR